MKTIDELTMLKEWIAQQREIYNNSNFDNDEKKLDEIKRQLVLQEITLQILVFENQCRDTFLENLLEEAKSKLPTTDDALYPIQKNPKYTIENFMHVSPDLRKQLEEAAENKIAKS